MSQSLKNELFVSIDDTRHPLPERMEEFHFISRSRPEAPVNLTRKVLKDYVLSPETYLVG